MGKTELTGELTGVEMADDLLIVHVKTKKPVVWHVRTGLQKKDIPGMAKLILRPSNIKYIIRILLRKDKENVKEPEDF